MGAPVRDLSLAVRALTRRPGVSLLAILSLGLAIGFCTAGFSLLDAFAWRDLPVREPARLSRVYVRDRELRFEDLSWAEYQTLQTHPLSWEGLAAECRVGPKVRLADRDDFPISAGVSENYFDLLGVKAALGNVFHTGSAPDGIAVITDHYWKTALGGDLNVFDRTLAVGKASLKIIGVLPAGFTGTNRGLLVDLFVPPQTFFGSLGYNDRLEQNIPDFEVFGRLRPGVALDHAKREEEAVLRKLEHDGLEPAPGREAVVFPFAEFKAFFVAMVMAPFLLVLLVAAANLANLRLVDNETRRHETGIRLALGAGRFDLLRQHGSETLLLCGLGTGLGLIVAAWLIDLVPALFFGGSYIDYGVRLDSRTLIFAAGALTLVAAIGSLIPLNDAWKRRVLPAIHATASVRSSRWLTALVVMQMAFVTAVTCSAGLLWRSLQNLSAIRPAMDPSRRLLLVEGYGDKTSEPGVRIERLASELSGLPGVLHVAYARRALLSGSEGGASVDLELPGQPKLSFFYNQVSPSYFATTGARILDGRGFRSSDGPRSTPVVMVNQAFVRRFITGKTALGAWIRIAGRDRQIVGVVEDGPTNSLKERIDPYFYFPFAQMPLGYATYFVESAREPEQLAAPVRSLVRRVDPGFTLRGMHNLRQHLFAARSDEAALTGIAGALALVGLVLAAAGLFGVTSYAVSRRMREFGLRVALGAKSADLRGQVIRGAAAQSAAGIPLGWGMALASRQVMQNLLYGVNATDPWILAAASGVVVLLALLASLGPALTAARADPMVALRYE